MMLEKRNETMATILLAVDACTPFAGLLKTAVMLAAPERATLLGMFVEDVRLLPVAALPFTREIGSLSAACHPLTPGSIDRRIRSIAEGMRRQLALAADQLQLPWEFRICPGSITQIANETDADVVVPGWSGVATFGRRRSLPSMPEARQRLKIGVIDDGSESALHAVSAARRLAAANRIPEVVIFSLTSTSSGNLSTGSDVNAMCTQHTTSETLSSPITLMAAGVEMPVQTVISTKPVVPDQRYALADSIVPVESVSQLIRALRSTRPALLLSGREQTFIDADRLRTELSIIGCPYAITR